MSLQPTRRAGRVVPKFAPATSTSTSARASAASAASTCSSTSAARWSAASARRRRAAATEDLADYARRLQAEPDELDAFLDRVTINVSQLWRHPEQWTALAARRSCPSSPQRGPRSAPGAPAAPTAPRPTRSPRSAARRSRRARRDQRHRHRPRAWSPARAQGRFTADDARGAPGRRRAAASSPAARPIAGAASGMVAFEVGDLLRMPVARGAYDLVHVPQHGHLLHRGGPRRAARAARRVAPARRLPDRRRHRARRRPARPRPQLPVPLHLPQGAEAWTSPSTSRCSWRRRASTSRSSTSPSSGSRSSPTTARRSTRSSASRTP